MIALPNEIAEIFADYYAKIFRGAHTKRWPLGKEIMTTNHTYNHLKIETWKQLWNNQK